MIIMLINSFTQNTSLPIFTCPISIVSLSASGVLSKYLSHNELSSHTNKEMIHIVINRLLVLPIIRPITAAAKVGILPITDSDGLPIE